MKRQGLFTFIKYKLFSQHVFYRGLLQKLAVKGKLFVLPVRRNSRQKPWPHPNLSKFAGNMKQQNMIYIVFFSTCKIVSVSVSFFPLECILYEEVKPVTDYASSRKFTPGGVSNFVYKYKGHVVVARDPNSDQKFDDLAVNNSWFLLAYTPELCNANHLCLI